MIDAWKFNQIKGIFRDFQFCCCKLSLSLYPTTHQCYWLTILYIHFTFLFYVTVHCSHFTHSHRQRLFYWPLTECLHFRFVIHCFLIFAYSLWKDLCPDRKLGGAFNTDIPCMPEIRYMYFTCENGHKKKVNTKLNECNLHIWNGLHCSKWCSGHLQIPFTFPVVFQQLL